MSETVDLTNCDREPIHIPGAIQPHGVLLACHGPTLTVSQVSENIVDHLGLPPDRVLAHPISALMTAESWQRVHRAVADNLPREMNPMTVVATAGTVFDAIIHRSPSGAIVVELEPQRGSIVGFHPRMRASVHRLQEADDKQRLAEVTAEEIRTLTGFDRVMVYRFDSDWHGHVVAEAKAEDLEPFLGLHYPAADIPAQARRLYTLNWLRIIPDISYQPTRLTPALDPTTNAALDLSFSVLRSVSPIHLAYLRNMGVTASMSVSLVREGRLIGLVACHHYSDVHHVSFAVRDSAEFLGQALSWHLATLEAMEAAERELATRQAESRLVVAIADAPSIAEGLQHDALLDITHATGAAIVYEGQVFHVGATPDESRIRRLAQWLSGPSITLPFVSDRLSDALPDAAAWDETAAGVLAVDISRALGEYIIWFRPSTERTVDWAGDPRKHETSDPLTGTPRLSPRGSFALWREVVRGRSLPWEPSQVDAASGLRKSLLSRLRARAAELRELNDQLTAADRAKDEFLSTVSHELRTPLNAILGWVHMLRTGELVAERRERALLTVERNARAQGQIIDDILDVSRIMSGKLKLNVEAVALGAVLDQTIEAMRPAADAKSIRLQATLDSSAVVMGDVSRLQQVANNLLMNAVKFTPKGGRVQIVVERRDSAVELTVADTGQGISAHFLPHVFERFRQADSSMGRKTGGLGLGLAIVRSIVELHGGTVDVASDGEGRGATFHVRLPMAVATRREVVDPPASTDRTARSFECPSQLVGLRILVVDDEADARELLATLLARCQSIVECAASAADGLRLLTTFVPDLLISDVGMPDVDGFAFIAQVRAHASARARQVPAIALTAYARGEDRTRTLLAGFQSHVPKPVEPMELLAVIASLTSGCLSRSH